MSYNILIKFYSVDSNTNCRPETVVSSLNGCSLLRNVNTDHRHRRLYVFVLLDISYLRVLSGEHL